MEINITDYFDQIDHSTISASIAELGIDAGKITWNNAKNCGYSMLKNETDFQEMRDYLSGFGAWGDSEIENFTNNELNALLNQLISGDIREQNHDRITFGNETVYYYIGE